MIIVLTSFVLIISFFITFVIRKQRMMKYVRHLPAPPEYPIVGSSFRFLGKDNQQSLEEFLKICETLPSPFRLWFGQYLVLFVDKAEDIKTILNSENCIEKSFIYRFFQQDVALFTAPAHIWRPQRKLLNPTFNFNILNSFIPIFNDKANLVIRNLEKEVGKDHFDISSSLFACTLEMVCATTLGYDVGVQSGRNQDYLEATEKSLTMIAQRIVNVFHHPDFIYKRTQLYKTERKYFEITQALPNRIIKSKMEEFAAKAEAKSLNEGDAETNDKENFKTPQIFIDQLFQLYKNGLIDDKMIEDQVALMIFGGNETSALTTSHAILLLAMHPDIQEKAVRELEDIYDNEYEDTDTEKLSKLQYLEMIMKETLRLFPVAPYLSRKCTKDTQISDCVIPKDTVILMSLHHLHRNKETWGPTPDIFDPEHFQPEKMAKRHPYCYLPFSGGARGCIGMKYGYMSVKIILSSLLRNYKFSTDLRMEDLRWKFELTVKLVNTHLVKIEKRNFKNSEKKV